MPPEPVDIPGPSTLRAELVDRRPLRRAGTVIGLAGAISGLTMLLAAAAVKDSYVSPCIESTSGPLALGGLGVLAITLVTGSSLALQKDEARITIMPLSSPRRPGRIESTNNNRVTGATLTLRF